MQERIVGYGMVGLGIVTMAFTLFQVYVLFTGQAKPFMVFEDKVAEKKESLSLQDMIADPEAATELQVSMFENVMEKQMNKTVNMAATVFFYYFVMLFGFRVASLGVQLVRPITVKLRSKSVEIDPKPEEPKK